MIAFASATQDIVIDAFRVESLSVEEQAAGMAGYVAAYRIGMLASGAGVVVLTAWLEAEGSSKVAVWPIAYGAPPHYQEAALELHALGITHGSSLEVAEISREVAPISVVVAAISVAVACCCLAVAAMSFTELLT